MLLAFYGVARDAWNARGSAHEDDGLALGPPPRFEVADERYRLIQRGRAANREPQLSVGGKIDDLLQYLGAGTADDNLRRRENRLLTNFQNVGTMSITTPPRRSNASPSLGVRLPWQSNTMSKP